MLTRRSISAVALVGISFVGVAGCGSSSSTSAGGTTSPGSSSSSTPGASPTSGTSTSCKQLEADLTSSQGTLTGITNAASAKAKFTALETKLTADASGGSSQLKTAVASFNSSLGKLLTDAEQRKLSAIRTDLAQLKPAATALEKSCVSG